MFSIFAMYAISASTFLLGKKLLLFASPLVLVSIRTLSAGVVFLVYTYFTRQKIAFNKIFLPCVTIAISSFYLSNTLKFWAIKYLSNSTAAIVSITEPLFVVVLAYYMFSERMSVQKGCALALCISSGFIVASNGSLQLNMQSANSFVLPVCMLLVAVGASAFGALLMRKLIVHNNVQPAVVNGVSMMLAGVVALGHSFFDQSLYACAGIASVPFVESMVAMVLLSNICAYSLYGYAVKRYSALLISCGSFVRPLCVIVYEWLFLHKAVAWHVPYAAVLLVVGLLMLYVDECQAKHAQQEYV